MPGSLGRPGREHRPSQNQIEFTLSRRATARRQVTSADKTVLRSQQHRYEWVPKLKLL
jgi:hypothetical protein